MLKVRTFIHFYYVQLWQFILFRFLVFLLTNWITLREFKVFLLVNFVTYTAVFCRRFRVQKSVIVRLDVPCYYYNQRCVADFSSNQDVASLHCISSRILISFYFVSCSTISLTMFRRITKKKYFSFLHTDQATEFSLSTVEHSMFLE